MMSPLGRITGLRSWLWLKLICCDAAAVGGHGVQVEHPFAFVFVGGVVAAAQRLVQARLGLPVAAEKTMPRLAGR
jgi:hypothetical protein